MKKSYHSIVVPIEEAAATRASEVFLTGTPAAACGDAPPVGEFVAVKTTPVFSVSPGCEPAALTDFSDAFTSTEKKLCEASHTRYTRKWMPGDLGHIICSAATHCAPARKNALADLAYNDARVAAFASCVSEELEEMLTTLARERSGSVYDATTVAFGRAAFRWAGVPVSTGEADRRAHQMSRLLDTVGRPATNPLAWVERARLDRWATGLIRGARDRARGGHARVAPDSVLAAIADLRDENGALVSDHTAAVELQNLTRPTVAVARFAAFTAVASVEHPDWAQRIREATTAAGRLTDIPETVAFAQEVRRVYPFVPMLPALAAVDTEIGGCPVHRGQRVFLDILGTNTDPNHWDDAGTFDPERFLDVADAEELAAFIPQGGAGVRSGHRCPGEKIAVTALSATVAALCRPGVEISDDADDLTFPWTRMLTLPATGVRLRYRATATT